MVSGGEPMEKIQIRTGDITQLALDAIVNAANTTLVGGGGVDGAIHRAAGPELLAACRLLAGCPTGAARITPGFRLPARWVIHTVGPVWRGGGHGEAVLLSRCYHNALRLALSEGIRSLGFPAISTGAYRYPKREAAQIALEAMRAWQEQLDLIVVCCFSEADAAIYRALCPACSGSD